MIPKLNKKITKKNKIPKLIRKKKNTIKNIYFPKLNRNKNN
jgi:hypothetical protein